MLDELVQWNAGSSSQEWYAYDNAGGRVLKRSTTGSGTSLTVYAFGTEEHAYTASGVSTGNTYYYSLAGRLIGKFDGGSNTQFFLTDALGSVLSTFKDVANTAAVLGNQAYGPYGNSQYHSGSLGTTKGFTGQYQDVTGLDYYNARFYDPVLGRFVSADTVVGNGQGADPYAYVGGNPETASDPSGHHPCADDGCSAPSSYFPNGGMTNGGWADNPPQLGQTDPNGPGQNYCIGYNCYNSVGQWLYSTYHPAAYQPPVQGHGNPEAVLGTCDSQCQQTQGNRDRTLITAHIQKEHDHVEAIATTVTDIIAFGADIVAAFMDFVTSTWGGFVIDALSAIARFAVILADFSSLGVLHLPSEVISIIGMIKAAVSIIDFAKGMLEFINPFSFLQDKFKLIIKSKGVQRTIEGIADLVAGSASYASSGINNGIDTFNYNGQFDAVSHYSNQQALSVCKQDYASDPGEC